MRNFWLFSPGCLRNGDKYFEFAFVLGSPILVNYSLARNYFEKAVGRQWQLHSNKINFSSDFNQSFVWHLAYINLSLPSSFGIFNLIRLNIPIVQHIGRNEKLCRSSYVTKMDNSKLQISVDFFKTFSLFIAVIYTATQLINSENWHRDWRHWTQEYYFFLSWLFQLSYILLSIVQIRRIVNQEVFQFFYIRIILSDEGHTVKKKNRKLCTEACFQLIFGNGQP